MSNEWISVEDELPQNKTYVLCLRRGNNWIVDNKPFKHLIARLERGISIEDRKKLPDGDARKTIEWGNDEGVGNNEKPYCWEEHGPGGEFGQDVTHWMPLPEPPTYDARLYHFCPLCNAHCNCDNNVCECSCSDDELD